MTANLLSMKAILEVTNGLMYFNLQGMPGQHTPPVTPLADLKFVTKSQIETLFGNMNTWKITNFSKNYKFQAKGFPRRVTGATKKKPKNVEGIRWGPRVLTETSERSSVK